MSINIYNCDDFVKTLPVKKCGNKIWLGTNDNLQGGEKLFVQYFNGDDEIVEIVDPIISGSNIFLNLNEPEKDFYTANHTYFVWLVDFNAYFSDKLQITNNGEHDGFIIRFSNANDGKDDKLVVV